MIYLLKKIKKHFDVSLLQKFKVGGIAICNHIYFAHKTPPESLKRHEIAHVMQYRRISLFNLTCIGFIIFLMRYIFEFLFGLICYRSWWTSHSRVSFEYEARTYEDINKFKNIKYITQKGSDS